MKTSSMNISAAQSKITALLLLIYASIYPAYSIAGMMGDNGMMTGGMWMMMAIWILVVVVLVLLAAALIKYLFSKR
jgi:uncharacterized membrane protein